MRRFVLLAVIIAVCATEGTPQTSTNRPDPATLRRSSLIWTQAEREFGFAHWESVYSGRTVPRGAQVRELPTGAPLAALRPGTSGAEALERFIVDEKVAGLIVLHNGVIRLERYRLGYSRRALDLTVSRQVGHQHTGRRSYEGRFHREPR
ncbi:MAG: hypothetical protein IPG76_04095 [Acidobacteria bacterium]|nr:hypothetical protein [Acidobacteriota bacterium]